MVACLAVDLSVAVAIRNSPDGAFRVVSAGRRAERARPQPVGDLGDRPFAVVEALRRDGVNVPAVEVAVAATLPEAAGLGSSAALCCAMVAAALRLTGRRLSPEAIAATALTAERDIVGVPCGPLDQRAVVDAPRDGVLILDCRDLSESTAPWPAGVCLIACDTGAPHDVGGAGYRRRRDEASEALALLDAGSWREVALADLGHAALAPSLLRRARHIVGETARTLAARAALVAADPVALGALMSASHVSLRDDYEVSTAALDAVTAAAREVPRCHGARLVGAGFGGTAIALVDESAAAACAEAMLGAASSFQGARSRTWRLHPGPGLALSAGDVIA